MPSLAVFALLLAVFAHAAPDPAQGPDASARARAAFESGSPVGQSAGAKEPAASGEDAEKLANLVRRTRALQAVKPQALPDCPRTPHPSADVNGCVMEAVRSLAADFGLRDPARIDAAVALYLARCNAPTGQTPAEKAAAQARADKLFADPRVPSAARARLQAVMGQSKAFAGAPDTGAMPGVALAAGPGTRTVDDALKEARGAPGLSAIKLTPIAVPSVSERLSRSAAEDEAILKIAPDDGTFGTAVGRSVTQVKKTGSLLLSYFTSGDTWKKTGQGAAQIVGNPSETAQYMPGAIKAGAASLWNGVKADVANASDEVGKFVEKPTCYRGAAAVGSVALALSNAFVVGGGVKTAVRRGAMSEVDQAVKDAAMNVARAGREGDIGAVVERASAPVKPVADPAARAIYTKTAVEGETVPFFIKQGIIDVDEHVTTTAKQQIMFKQTGPTCIFGALCNMYQGVKDVAPQDVLAAIRRENPAYSNAMDKSNISATSMERISNELATKAGRAPVALSSTQAILAHMRSSGQPVLVGVQTGTGQHAIVLSEAMVTKEGKVYFKTLDTNISELPGSGAARTEKFGIISADDLQKILTTKGISHS